MAIAWLVSRREPAAVCTAVRAELRSSPTATARAPSRPAAERTACALTALLYSTIPMTSTSRTGTTRANSTAAAPRSPSRRRSLRWRRHWVRPGTGQLLSGVGRTARRGATQGRIAPPPAALGSRGLVEGETVEGRGDPVSESGDRDHDGRDEDADEDRVLDRGGPLLFLEGLHPVAGDVGQRVQRLEQGDHGISWMARTVRWSGRVTRAAVFLAPID